MIHNKHTLSSARETSERRLATKNPLYRIGTLLNAYHSIDHRPTSQEMKDDLKKQFEREIKRQLHYVSEDLHSQIKMSIKNKTFWESLRDRIM